jgi:uncharacterized membrane protein YhaH (DUF805 family)
MTFADSIKSGFAKYVDFNGRASRSEFWWWVLFTFLATLVLTFISGIVANLFSLAVLIPSIAVAARRLHDIDKSGWWQLVGLIPLLGLLLMIYWCVQPAVEPNRFGGEAPAEAEA